MQGKCRAPHASSEYCICVAEDSKSGLFLAEGFFAVNLVTWFLMRSLAEKNPTALWSPGLHVPSPRYLLLHSEGHQAGKLPKQQMPG